MKRLSWFVRFLKPIKTRRDYEAALALVEKHFDAKRGTRQRDIVEVLTVLIEKYEEENFPIGAPDPIEAIKFRMEQLGMKPKDLIAVIGGRGRVSEVLNYKRGLSVAMIRKLHKKLQIPADVLVG